MNSRLQELMKYPELINVSNEELSHRDNYNDSYYHDTHHDRYDDRYFDSHYDDTSRYDDSY